MIILYATLLEIATIILFLLLEKLLLFSLKLCYTTLEGGDTMPEPLYNPAKKRRRVFLEELYTLIDEKYGPMFYDLSPRERLALYQKIKKEVIQRCRD